MADLFQQDNPMSGSQWVAGSMPASMLGSAGPVKVDAATFAAEPSTRRRRNPADLWSDPDALHGLAQRAADCGDRLVATMFVAARGAAIAHQRPVTVSAAANRFLRHRPGTPNREKVQTVCITKAATSGTRYDSSREAIVNRWRIAWTATSLALVGVIGYLFVSGMFLLPTAMQRISLQPLPVVDAQPPAPGPPAPDLNAPVISPHPMPPVVQAGLPLTSADAPRRAAPLAEPLPPQAAEAVEPIIVQITDDAPAAPQPVTDEPIEPVQSILIETPGVSPGTSPGTSPEVSSENPPAPDPDAVFEAPMLVDVAGQPIGMLPSPYEMPDEVAAAADLSPMLPEPVVIDVVEQPASEDVPTLTLHAPESADGDSQVRFAPDVAQWINSPDGPWQSILWRDRDKSGSAPKPASVPEVPEQAAAILDRVFQPIQKVLDQHQ